MRSIFYYFEPKQKSSNQIWAIENARCLIIAKRRWIVKVSYVIFFDIKGPVMQSPVSKDSTENWRSSRKIAAQNQILNATDPCMIMHSLTRHDCWPSFWSQSRSPPYHSLHFRQTCPRPAPCDYILFQKLNYHLPGKRYNSRNALGSEVSWFLMDVPLKSIENCFQMWIEW